MHIFLICYQDFLNEGLKERMKYLRGTSGRPRKQHSESASTSTPKHKEPQVFPASPTVPMIPEGEDRQSHDRHLRILKAECGKLHQNSSNIQQLMERTFAFRRSDVLSNSVQTADLLKRYSPLKTFKGVCTLHTSQ